MWELTNDEIQIIAGNGFLFPFLCGALFATGTIAYIANFHCENELNLLKQCMSNKDISLQK